MHIGHYTSVTAGRSVLPKTYRACPAYDMHASMFVNAHKALSFRHIVVYILVRHSHACTQMIGATKIEVHVTL